VGLPTDTESNLCARRRYKKLIGMQPPTIDNVKRAPRFEPPGTARPGVVAGSRGQSAPLLSQSRSLPSALLDSVGSAVDARTSSAAAGAGERVARGGGGGAVPRAGGGLSLSSGLSIRIPIVPSIRAVASMASIGGAPPSTGSDVAMSPVAAPPAQVVVGLVARPVTAAAGARGGAPPPLRDAPMSRGGGGSGGGGGTAFLLGGPSRPWSAAQSSAVKRPPTAGGWAPPLGVLGSTVVR
jgi:hypothetical protein